MLPVILKAATDEAYNNLVNEYVETYNEKPSIKQENAWKKLLDLLQELNVPHPIILEYPIFTERADIIFADKDKAVVVEAKGWRSVKKLGDNVVEADGELHLDPCYQLNNYVYKLNFFHSSNLKFKGLLFLYNTRDYSSEECKTLRTIEELRNELKNLPSGDLNDARKIVDSKLMLKHTFIELVKKVKEKRLKDVSKVLLSTGYGLTEEQMRVLKDVLDSLDKGERKNFIIQGESGSGKSLLAITLYLEALSRGYFAILAYKNNRLISAVRQALGSELSSLVMFYSTGRNIGIGEKGFDEWFSKHIKSKESKTDIDLIVFDEAQRMTDNVIRNSPKGKINVYFYDDSQVLIGNEAGTRENLLKYLQNVSEYKLSSPFREPKQYLEFVRKILQGEKAKSGDFDFKIFDNITDMFNELKNEKNHGMKTALICSFTESEGDNNNKTSWESIKNIRIGYPLQSGFDLYKGMKYEGNEIKVKWLMDEKTEYPRYWKGELDSLKYCSSVYGSQGFEADYVGVVWGRDLIWHNGEWIVNSGPITDYVGGSSSLKKLANNPKKRDKALLLLKNRYYIMLTRGIRGVYVFFEDKGTAKAVKGLVQ
ncbi:DNA/RNA helicase domain-containing protein [Acidianus brierleyi]|uniref:ATP-binding protein n=1 Tax=Acidianus brierleyi TaxID=41673 RepID=A0A2U9IJ43_9CREN|nr:DNA/RNA helicase domain-containing protein [Acidianus brierleyi]AWR96040.1 DUF2075 domain-containing protein [Acidianus brierleyi]